MFQPVENEVRPQPSFVHPSSMIHRQDNDLCLANLIENSIVANPQRPRSFERPNERLSCLRVLGERSDFRHDLFKDHRLGPSKAVKVPGCSLRKLDGQRRPFGFRDRFFSPRY